MLNKKMVQWAVILCGVLMVGVAGAMAPKEPEKTGYQKVTDALRKRANSIPQNNNQTCYQMVTRDIREKYRLAQQKAHENCNKLQDGYTAKSKN